MQELHEYIRSAKAAGTSDETIMSDLKAAGWQEDVISQALMNQSAPSPVVPITTSIDSKIGQFVTKFRKPVVAIFVILILVFAGYKAAYFSSNPEKVWKDTKQNMLDIKSGHFGFEVSYSETLPQDTGEDSFTSFLGGSGELKASISGDGAMALKGDDDVDYDMNSTISYKLGSLNVSLGFLSKKIGDYVYYKVDGNPLLGLFGSFDNSDTKKSSWVKMNIKKDKGEFAVLDTQKSQLIEAYKKANIMTPTKLLGSETINGVATWHYETTLNKSELKNYMDEVLKATNSAEEYKKNVNMVIDKLEFKKQEIWIGKSDHLIHQAEILVTSPSVISASLDGARNKSRDARRIADVSQLRVAFELFFDENGRYPQSVNGQPSTTDGKVKFSTYIADYPQAPTPADGTCTDENNKYIYQQLDKGQSYKLDFCIGGDVSGHQAGVLELTPEGIVTIVPSSNPSQSNPWEDIPFTGLISVKLNLSDFNSNIKIEEPLDAKDLTDEEEEFGF